ncbi:MAG: NAD(P)H-dependent oxidoreductase [Litorilinea sp.]
MTDSIHVLAFAGSLRVKSVNKALIRAAAAQAPAYVTVSEFDLLGIPLYNGDVEALGVPAAVQHFRTQLAQADALLIACPEYNYSVTGVLKNAIDWASRGYGPDDPSPLTAKPAAIVGAGGRYGTVRAQSHLRYILLHNDVKVLNKPEVMVPLARQHFDEDLKLTNADTAKLLGQLMEALAAWTRQLQAQ